MKIQRGGMDGHFVDGLRQDLLYARRSLGRNKGYAAVAILTLALGLGGAVTAFVIADRVLLRPLPYPDADRLVSVIQAEEMSGGLPVSVGDYARLRPAARSFASLEALVSSERNLHIGDAIEPVQTAQVTGGLFSTIGVPPMVGRFIMPGDAVRSAPPVVVLGHALWRRVFGGDMAIVGRTITLSNIPYIVVGVMPPAFSIPDRTQLWTACTYCERPPAGRVSNAEIVGRLGSASIAEARAELGVLWQRMYQNAPLRDIEMMGRITAVPLHEEVVGDSSRRIYLVAAGMGILLLIGCANLASATMARNVTRGRELALRSALGASRRRLVQQLAIESLVLSGAACAAGLGLAALLVPLVVRFGATHVPRLQELAIDGRTILFAVALAMGAALLIGLLPALQAAGRNLAGQVANHRTGGARGVRTRGPRVLLGFEVALCLIVVAAAGLAARSLQLVYRQPIGIDTSGLATIKPQIDLRRLQRPGGPVAEYDRVLERMARIPGVRAVAAATTVPLGEAWIGLLEIEGRPELKQPIGGYNLVTEGFFETVGVPLRRGRLLMPTDLPGTEPVTVINQAMANRYWPGEDPIGRRIRAVSFDRGTQPVWLRIVGVVAEMRTLSLETRYQPIHYVSARQYPALLSGTTIIARGSGSASALLPALRSALAEVDPTARGLTATVDEMVQATTRDRRQAASVLAGLAGLALLLAGIGIYGVLACSVAQRVREIGIRMALGATAARVVRQTLADLGLPVVMGLAVGLLAARAASQMFAALVFGITPTDPLVLTAASAAIVALALVASYVPARRAARVDPTVSLRAE